MSETNTSTTRMITIDGQEAEAYPDETALSVAGRLGIDIPALCHHPAVTTYGACRLCVVEVKKGKRSRMVTSCIYIPAAGDIIETGNERVRKLRRMILELLLARCPEVEVLQRSGRTVRHPRGPPLPGLRRRRRVGTLHRLRALRPGVRGGDRAARDRVRQPGRQADDRLPVRDAGGGTASGAGPARSSARRRRCISRWSAGSGS